MLPAGIRDTWVTKLSLINFFYDFENKSLWIRYLDKCHFSDKWTIDTTYRYLSTKIKKYICYQPVLEIHG